MQKIYLQEIHSTNTFLLDALSKGEEFKDETMVYTTNQTAGRGQIGNSWEAEKDKNIAFSILLKPAFLAIREQFLLSEITSIAIVEALSEIIAEITDAEGFTTKKCCIKWPNDIYVGDDKIGGILIENSLQGSTMKYSVVGVGVNINQTHWIGNAPNPTSLKLVLGRELKPLEVLDKMIEKFSHYYNLLKERHKDEIHTRYLSLLYRNEGFHQYQDVATEKVFSARIISVEPSGFLHLEDMEGKTYSYMFKEVKFVLPCGVTKE